LIRELGSGRWYGMIDDMSVSATENPLSGRTP
jgi:hypothetical protein